MQTTTSISAQRAREIAQSLDLHELPQEFYANPYPIYDWLREHEPIRRMSDGSLFLTRHADLVSVYRDAHTFSSDKKAEFAPKFNKLPFGSDGANSPLYEHHTSSLVFNDPPLHTRVRKILMGALSRRAIAELETSLIELVNGLLDRMEKNGGGDLIEDFASAIPIEIIGNLLGIPHAERAPLRGWSLSILGALEPKLSPAQEQLGNQSVHEFKAYLQSLVIERRKHPGNPEHDVLTRLIESESELTETELLQNCIFILNAGHETTTNLIGNALIALQEHPRALQHALSIHEHSTKQIRRLSADLSLKTGAADDSMTSHRLSTPILTSTAVPARSSAADAAAIWETAIDEFLRFESSNQLSNRRAVRDFELGGQHFAAGTLLTLCIGAANRDPAVFDNPNELQLSRTPNKHLAFGYGIHQCAGMQLARLEGRIALQLFLQRFPNYQLTQAPVRGGRARFRGFLKAPFRSR